MKALFWNIRGMGKKSRVGLLKEHMFKEQVDIVGVQETIKHDFTEGELSLLSNGRPFQWKWLPARWHSRGISVGVKTDLMEVEDWFLGEHLIGVSIRQRLNNFRWQLVVVYGPAQHEYFADFLSEQGDFLTSTPLPCLVGGDFNLIRSLNDKSNGSGHDSDKCLQ